MDFQTPVSEQSYGIDGEPKEFEWNIFQGLTSLVLRRKIQDDLQRRNIDLRISEIEFSSCPSSTTLIGTRRSMKENVFQIPQKSGIMRRVCCQDNGHSLDLEVKKSGKFHSCQNLKANGTPWLDKCYNDSWRQDIQFLHGPVLSVVESWLAWKNKKTPFTSRLSLRMWISCSESFTPRIVSVFTEHCRAGVDSPVLEGLSHFWKDWTKAKKPLTKKRRRVWIWRK